jgi:hypothetical protein
MAAARRSALHQVPLIAGEVAFVAAAVGGVAGYDRSAVVLAIAGLALFAIALIAWLLRRGNETSTGGPPGAA